MASTGRLLTVMIGFELVAVVVLWLVVLPRSAERRVRA